MNKILFLLSFLVIATVSNAQTLLRKGSSSYGDVLYNWDGKFLRQGSSSYGNVLINWDGKNVRVGSSSYGDILYNTDGKFPLAILVYIIE